MLVAVGVAVLVVLLIVGEVKESGLIALVMISLFAAIFAARDHNKKRKR